MYYVGQNGSMFLWAVVNGFLKTFGAYSFQDVRQCCSRKRRWPPAIVLDSSVGLDIKCPLMTIRTEFSSTSVFLFPSCEETKQQPTSWCPTLGNSLCESHSVLSAQSICVSVAVCRTHTHTHMNKYGQTFSSVSPPLFLNTHSYTHTCTNQILYYVRFVQGGTWR